MGPSRRLATAYWPMASPRAQVRAQDTSKHRKARFLDCILNPKHPQTLEISAQEPRDALEIFTVRMPLIFDSMLLDPALLVCVRRLLDFSADPAAPS